MLEPHHPTSSTCRQKILIRESCHQRPLVSQEKVLQDHWEAACRRGLEVPTALGGTHCELGVSRQPKYNTSKTTDAKNTEEAFEPSLGQHSMYEGGVSGNGLVIYHQHPDAW